MKKGMLFGLFHREQRVKKINLLHFPVFTVILKLPEPSTDSISRNFNTNVASCYCSNKKIDSTKGVEEADH